MITRIKRCRICSNPHLVKVIDFGPVALTGKFPTSKKETVPCWPLEVVKCEGNKEHCGLLQLAHQFPEKELFGQNYGYRSGLNPVIVDHLNSIVLEINQKIALKKGDIVCDVGSNDGTMLNGFKTKDLIRIGIDPTADKFSKFYDPHIIRINEFFNCQALERMLKGKKIKVLTSISMFYDLNDPLSFMRDVKSLLDHDGLWVLEQSYLPSILKNNAFDSICHEHVAYYGLKQVLWMVNIVGLDVVDVVLTELNGGSIKVTLAHKHSKYPIQNKRIASILKKESQIGTALKNFVKRISLIKKDVQSFFCDSRKNGYNVIGYGASTKGNVLLQVCSLSCRDISFIMDINPDKWGCYTPGSKIPIVNEDKSYKSKADYLFVLPWHFKEYFLNKEKRFLSKHKGIVFPLPQFKIVSKISDKILSSS